MDRTPAGAVPLNLPVVDCGFVEARARGRAHGESLRAVIRDKIGRWRTAIEADYGEAPSSFIARLLAHTRFDAAIARHTPELADEVRGIAEGAGIEPDVACALQLMDEEWWFGRAAHEGHCSSAGFAPLGERATVLGQTMDLPAWHDGAQALLRLRNADGSQTLMFTSAGMIGLMGVAGQGLGLCVNTLGGLRSRLDGLPVAYVVRGALAARDTTGAARFLCAVPHASGQNYTIADRQTVRAFECSAAGAVELTREDGRLLHANDPLASADWRAGPVASGNSAARLAVLRGECEGSLGPWVETLKAALCSRRDGAAISIRPAASAKPSSLMSIGGVVYEIGDAIRFWVSAGPPSPESWRETTVQGPAE